MPADESEEPIAPEAVNLRTMPPHRNCIWIFGISTTGKSVFTNVLCAVLGGYAITLPAELLIRSRTESRMACSLADIRNKRAVFLNEVPDGQIDDTTLKMLSSHDRIKVRGLYRNAIEFKPTHTLLATTNHRPVIDDAGGAVFRRLCPIPFQARVAHPDPDLKRKLLAEAGGILNWMIAGARRMLNEPDLYRKPPELVRTEQAKYRRDMDIIANFVEECCEACAAHTVTATASLFAVFRLWTRDINQFDRMTRRCFTGLLEEAGYRSERYGSGSAGTRMRGVSGIRINEAYQRLHRLREGKEIEFVTLPN